jgi:hypothetical protein
MGDLLGSLVQGSQKRTILCVIWGGMLHKPLSKVENMRKLQTIFVNFETVLKQIEGFN